MYSNKTYYDRIYEILVRLIKSKHTVTDTTISIIMDKLT
jgi:hypothetical protein